MQAAVQAQHLEVVTALMHQGAELIGAKRYQAAIACFEHVLRLQPDHYAAWYSHGDALAHLASYSEALSSFDQALALQPNYPEAWTFRAAILIYLHRYAEAIEDCDQALAIVPDYAEAWTFRGAALQHLGQYKAAYASYARATKSPSVTTPQTWQQRVKRFLGLS